MSWLERLVRGWTAELRAGRLWPGLGVLTLLTYNTWVLWKPLNGHRVIFSGYLSEFSASDQPHSFFFRGGDLITAIIVLGLGSRALLLWRRRLRRALAGAGPRPGRWWAAAAVFLLVFGVSTFFDAFFAMDCSPSLSDRCRVLEETGQLSAVHYAHTFTSVGAQVGIVASMVATCIAMVRSPRHTRLKRSVVFALTALEVVALVVMMAMLVVGAPGLGYPQAVMVIMASVWFALIGFRLVGEDAREPLPPGAAEKPVEHRQEVRAR
jgi:hypothetical protein